MTVAYFLAAIVLWMVGWAVLEHWAYVRRRKRDPYYSVNDE